MIQRARETRTGKKTSELHRVTPGANRGHRKAGAMKTDKQSFNGNRGMSQAIIVWPGGIHGGKKPVIYPLGMTDRETEAIREIVEKALYQNSAGLPE